MRPYKKELIEARLRKLIGDIRDLHTAVIAADTYYAEGETLDQWVVLEVTTLQTMLQGIQSMAEAQVSVVGLFLYLEEAAIWMIKHKLLTGSMAEPLHFRQEHARAIMETFHELVTAFTNATSPEVGPDRVAAVVDRFKETLASGLAFFLSCDHLRGKEWVIRTDDATVRWPTKDEIASFF